MRRITCPERDDWRTTAEACGFDFHTLDGERYWDERAYYAFSLDEIERQIETPTGEIDAMCLELVDRAIRSEKYLRALRIPEAYWPLISESWHRDDASLYGRLDLSFDGRGPAKLLEYNADTPTSIFEAAVFQWTWLEQAIERRIVPACADQFNSIHERLIEAWKKLGAGRHLHLAGMIQNVEDAGTLAYLEDTARQAGLSTTLIDIENIGLRDDGRFVDLDDRPIEFLSNSIPGNGCFRTPSAQRLQKRRRAGSSRHGRRFYPTRACCRYYGKCFPAILTCCRRFSRMTPTPRSSARLMYVSRFIRARAPMSRWLAGASRWWSRKDHMATRDLSVRRCRHCQIFRNQYAVLGSWLIDHVSCGLSIREDENPITGNTSRFLPHAIL